MRPQNWIAEAIGTFFLVFIGCGTAMVDASTNGGVGHVGVALAFGFVLACMVYAIGHISGCHINPAVTLGLWSARKFPASGVVPYIVAQCVGATVATWALRFVLGPVGNLGATIPAIGDGAAFLVEFVLSFALMFVIMGATTHAKIPPGVSALGIGLTLAFSALMGGLVTGASLNPARSLGPALLGGGWESHWLYWAAPIAGMLVAAQVHVFLSGPSAEKVSS